MVISLSKLATRRRAGLLMTDLVVSMALLCIAIIPIVMGLAQERRYLRANYHHAIAMEIVDGEMELLVAGEWRNYPDGTHQLTPRANATANLPLGRFQLTVAQKQLRLEWLPNQAGHGGRVCREVTLP